MRLDEQDFMTTDGYNAPLLCTTYMETPKKEGRSAGDP